MKVVDKEQERIERAKTPQGKQLKKAKALIVLGIVAAMAFYIYNANHNPLYIGSSHIVTVSGVTVEPGKTTVSDLLDTGFYIADNSVRGMNLSGGRITSGYDEPFSPDAPVEASSYYDMLRLVKDGKAYAYVSVVNESSRSATLADCKVRSITVYASDEEANTASLHGISMDQLTIERLAEAAGELKKVSDDLLSDVKRTEAKWAKGNYSMELTVNEDGTVYSFSSGYEKR